MLTWKINRGTKRDKNPNWLDKNKFEKFLAIIDSNKFNYKYKIGEFKYINIIIIELVKYLLKKI